MANKKSIVITGVSSGIGLALAEYFLDNNYRVFGSVRKVEDADALKQKYQTDFEPLIMDVVDEQAVVSAADQVKKALDGETLYGLINNAGVSILGPIVHQPMSEIRLIFDVNSFAPLSVSRAFLPLLGFGNDSCLRPGRIVNISSVSGGYTVPFLGAYSGSKHALEAFTQALRRELIPEGIHVCAIEPNFIKSKITDEVADSATLARYENTSLGRAWQAFLGGVKAEIAKADEPIIVAKAAEHALESNKPKARYPLHSSWRIGRWLKDQTFDKLLFKGTGLDAYLIRKK